MHPVSWRIGHERYDGFDTALRSCSPPSTWLRTLLPMDRSNRLILEVYKRNTPNKARTITRGAQVEQCDPYLLCFSTLNDSFRRVQQFLPTLATPPSPPSLSGVMTGSHTPHHPCLCCSLHVFNRGHHSPPNALGDRPFTKCKMKRFHHSTFPFTPPKLGDEEPAPFTVKWTTTIPKTNVLTRYSSPCSVPNPFHFPNSIHHPFRLRRRRPIGKCRCRT